jgi:cytoskeletal protein RodZ
MAQRNSVIGELKGKIEVLINEVLPRIESKIMNIEESLNNHLSHHLKHDEKKSERWFRIGMLVLQVILSGMVTYLLIKK